MTPSVAWIDPVNRDAFFMELVVGVAVRLQSPMHVITTVRSGAGMAADASVSPFFRAVKTLPIGAVPTLTRLQMLLEYRSGFDRAAASLSPDTSVLYSSESSIQSLETGGLRRIRSRARKLTRLVHNIGGTSLGGQNGVFDDWIFLSEFTRARALDKVGMDPERTLVIALPHFHPLLEAVVPDASLASQLRRWAGERRMISFISRPTEAHGIDRFYRTLRMASDQGLPVCGAIIGRPDSGWTERRDRAARAHWRLKSDLVWSALGTYSFAELLSVLGQTDAMVAPYRKMSQSAAVALAVGEHVPVLASRAGANPEMVREGIDGLLFDADDENGLLTALVEVYSGGGKARARFGNDQLVDHLDPSLWVTRLMQRLQT